jgi:orotidine-5'-phosphate decarboxylase
MNVERSGYFDKLAARCERIESSLCIGLDPDPRRIPPKLGSGPDGVYKFCCEIVDATSDYAAAFKPNLAFFEAIGVEGWHVLNQVLERIDRQIPTIVDAKRGDIGSTAQFYARSIFDRLKADAVTVNPLLGHDSVEPFLTYETKGIYVLCLTSNAGARDFQIPDDLYLRIASRADAWNKAGNVGLVVGATKPKQLTLVRKAAPNLPILIPGLGAQGGDLDELMSAARDEPRHFMLFNVSRSILYASKGSDFGHAARKAARFYFDRINTAREKTLSDA